MALKQWPYGQMKEVLFSIFFVSILLVFKLTRRTKTKTNLNLPPSPPKLPIIGNLHQLGALPHRSLWDLSLKYGDMMLLQLGQRKTPTLVVSSTDVTMEIMKTHDLAFSNRFQNTAAKILLYDCKEVGFGSYGESWKQKRKICVHELLSMKMVQSFRVIREEEVAELVDKLREASSNEECVNLRHVCVGGSDPTSATLEWAISELVRHPMTLKKAQEEVRKVVGDKSKVEEDDIKQMHYLKCVVKETLRLHPPATILTPRETISSVKLKGYDIPAKTMVYINIWAIQRSPEFWESPEEFLPERFKNSQVEFRGQDFQFFPFGFGRRGCPGMNFGIASIEYVLANLLYWFDWKLPQTDQSVHNIDMSEIMGLVVSKKMPLYLKPISYSI